MQAKQYDLAVIGAGPAGYVGAIRAAQLGMKTAVIEEDRVGGVCLNRGCIPSKSLIHQAGQYMMIPALTEMGLKVDASGFDYTRVQSKSAKAAALLSGGVAYLLKKNNIDVINGHGRLIGRNRISVDNSGEIRADRILLATGSRPRPLPGLEFDGETILSSDDLLALSTLPKRIVITGGGAIGCEFAHIMNGFGVQVTLVEMLDRLLPQSEADSVAVLQRAFTQRGIDIRTGTVLASAEKSASGIRCRLQGNGNSDTVEADIVAVVTGRVPNTEDLGLDTTATRSERGYILTGDYYQTDEPGLYAVGDIIPGIQLAHAASAQAKLAVEHMAGRSTALAIPEERIPSAVYTEPQIAGFGLTAEDADAKGISAKKLVFPYRGAGKSVAAEVTEGQVQIVLNDDTDEILGAHIVGAEATELIHEVLLAADGELLPEDIINTVHAHPTLSEILPEVFEQAAGASIHI